MRNYETKRVHRNFYRVSEGSLHMDRRRRCAKCGKYFALGDWVSVVITARQGNLLLHTECLDSQEVS